MLGASSLALAWNVGILGIIKTTVITRRNSPPEKEELILNEINFVKLILTY